jgi:hypothetical protein
MADLTARSVQSRPAQDVSDSSAGKKSMAGIQGAIRVPARLIVDNTGYPMRGSLAAIGHCFSMGNPTAAISNRRQDSIPPHNSLASRRDAAAGL